MSIAAILFTLMVVMGRTPMHQHKYRLRKDVFQKHSPNVNEQFPPLRSGQVFSFPDKQARQHKVLLFLPGLSKRPDGLKREGCGHGFLQVHYADWVPCVLHYLRFHSRSYLDLVYRTISHSFSAFPPNIIVLLDSGNFEIIL